MVWFAHEVSDGGLHRCPDLGIDHDKAQIGGQAIFRRFTPRFPELDLPYYSDDHRKMWPEIGIHALPGRLRRQFLLPRFPA